MESLIEKRERLIREQKEVERQMNLLEEQENREEAKRIISKMKEKNLPIFDNKDGWVYQFDRIKYLRTPFTSQVLMLNEILPHGIEYDDYDSLVEALVEEVKNQAPVLAPAQTDKLKPGEVYVQGVHPSIDGKVILPTDAKDLIFISCDELRKTNRVGYLF